jgi:hypothetical protein
LLLLFLKIVFADISSVEEYSNILQTSLENRLVSIFSIPKDRRGDFQKSRCKSQFLKLAFQLSYCNLRLLDIERLQAAKTTIKIMFKSAFIGLSGDCLLNVTA